MYLVTATNMITLTGHQLCSMVPEKKSINQEHWISLLSALLRWAAKIRVWAGGLIINYLKILTVGIKFMIISVSEWKITFFKNSQWYIYFVQ